ncbi:PTS lactose/cellobiose transporter subunit IIA [Thermosediminibacter litoriperuensis]|uniref:PTS system cellobiose-specific IIA component n=1 Tax=Thermosediminibacter litoriperuensis TaxID=291989 RepID=A0A5S5AQE4_9FIRM|nr:PTS lactose/cellobiose transporter subunit IIA [Thermosediminibacter litoriperuensis]TYP54250.1 PTS system cellobiose-specific IIA component [Thermosediminibacter litoriperuensis]
MESIEEIAFRIISAAGDSLSMMFEAMKLSRNGKFEEAEKLMQKADDFLLQAHKVQTELIAEESRGNRSEYSILMVHAQDHIMNAMLAKPLIREIINLYKRLG